MITIVEAQQEIISCLDITVPLMTPSTPAYRNKYCRHHSAVSRNRFSPLLNYCVTIANYHHHCRDLYVNSSRQSKLINFFSTLPLTQCIYLYKTPTSSKLVKQKRKEKRKARHPSLFFAIQYNWCTFFSLKSNSLDFFFVCVYLIQLDQT